MKENRHETLRDVFRFLNVDESFDLRATMPSTTPRSLTVSFGARWNGAGWAGRSGRTCPVRSSTGQRPAARGRAVDPPSLDSGLREALRDYLREDVDRLRSQVGRDFAQWSI